MTSEAGAGAGERAEARVGEITTAGVMNWRQQLYALLSLNLLAARRQPSYFIGGLLLPLMMVGIAIGVSAAIQSSLPNINVGSRVKVPIVAAAGNLSRTNSFPYVATDSLDNVWRNQLQTKLTRSLTFSPSASPNFTHYKDMTQLADHLVNTLQKQRQQGINDAPNSPVIGYALTRLDEGSNGNLGQFDYGFTMLFDDKEGIRAPIALNAMNVASQSISGNDSTSTGDANGLQLQSAINTFPARKEERALISTYFVPAFTIYGLSHFISFFAVTMVREKEHGHRAHLSSMGIGSRVYLLASFIRDILLSIIPVIASIVLLAIAKVPVFTEGSALPWIFIELLLFIPLIGQAYLVSNLFERTASVGAIMGVGMAVIVFVPSLIVKFVLNDVITITTICIITIFLPTFGANQALSQLAIDTSQYHPYTSADTFNIYRTVLPVLLSLIASAIFYWAIELRVDARIQSGQPATLLGTLIKKIQQSKSKNDTSKQQEHRDEEEEGETLTDEEALEEKRRLQQGLPSTDGKDDAVRLLGLTKQFPSRLGPKTVLNGIWMATRTSECFGYLGPNGAGKTTTLKILTGQLAATSGTATIGGLSIEPYDTRIHSLLGVCPQHDILWLKLTAREHLRYFARIKGVANNEVEGAVEEMIQMLDLAPVADRYADGYSGGNKRRLSLAMACIGHPQVLFLDEPTTGVDVGVRRKIWACIRRLKERASVVLTTHSMEEADALCDRIAVMVNGRVQAIGTPQRLKNVYGAGYKILVKTAHPNGALGVQRELARELGAHCVQLLGCHLEMDCERREEASAMSAEEAASMLARQTTLSQVFVSFAEKQKTI
ncbi:hypothetical protein BDF22DRAFT_733929 [Syncephalis plumigaleata]|nr:hypothetical protein BDF22DRAFT_733929 [Syncephalis plumigaleata]